MNDDEPVLLHTEGHSLHITLNRPRALNALTHTMVRSIDEALTLAEQDDAVTAVVISGAGERGLCAGGDIRSIYEDARAGRRASVDFWRDEYRLNARIARFPKPYVALMDGIVMGGGVGVSAHGDVRIVTERSRVAMPETGIGFVPDVGGTYLLAAAPGELGTHLALTGQAVGAADTLLCGLADHFVPSERLAELTEALALGTTPAEVTETVRRYATTAPEGSSRRTAHGSTPATAPTPSRRSSAASSTVASPRRRRPSGHSSPSPPPRSRSPLPLCAAPGVSKASKRHSTRSSGSPAGPSPDPIWWRACAPRSSTRTVVRSGTRPSRATSPTQTSPATSNRSVNSNSAWHRPEPASPPSGSNTAQRSPGPVTARNGMPRSPAAALKSFAR